MPGDSVDCVLQAHLRLTRLTVWTFARGHTAELHV